MITAGGRDGTPRPLASSPCSWASLATVLSGVAPAAAGRTERHNAAVTCHPPRRPACTSARRAPVRPWPSPSTTGPGRDTARSWRSWPPTTSPRRSSTWGERTAEPVDGAGRAAGRVPDRRPHLGPREPARPRRGRPGERDRPRGERAAGDHRAAPLPVPAAVRRLRRDHPGPRRPAPHAGVELVGRPRGLEGRRQRRGVLGRPHPQPAPRPARARSTRSSCSTTSRSGTPPPSPPCRR